MSMTLAEVAEFIGGEVVGDGSEPHVDVAVDPIDGTTLTAHGKTNALSVIAVSDRGSMLDPGPSFYMEKIAVGPESVGAIDITASPTQNLRWIAKSKRASPEVGFGETTPSLNAKRFTSGSVAVVMSTSVVASAITSGAPRPLAAHRS